MEKVIIYSSHSGNRDNPVQDGRLYVDGCDKFNTNRMIAKAPKILPHLYLPEHDISIWVDANLELTCKVEDMVKELDDFDCLIFHHPDRKTINEEIIACKTLDSDKNLQYHKDKPGDLAWCGIIVRRNSDRVNEYNEYWWSQICRGSSRDQLSFPYTLGKIAKYLTIKGSYFHNQFTKRNNHINDYR